MNNLEVILESIINEGNTESQKILDEANAKANEIINEKRNEADKRAREIIESAKKEAETIRKNETVSTERQSRDIEINAKNQVIDKVVDELLENLKNLDSDSYKRYVENTLNKSNIINGEILLSKKHKDALKNENFKGLKVSDDTVEDGFVVKSGKIEYDNRFSSIIKYNIDNIRKQISDEIFK
ncbi:V-type ATP synthase subunit E [Anaerococcus nagyae]|jgi:ATP synthase, subunit E|uniref:V-type ATP synthase subunit E n=1 Tax=Anaerococcus nagyae TaxID=1755241 RepID=UPI001AE18EEB|nr:V-type ATP synthase subunit E [Anaerococcus nagyae]MBP2069244.1 V/A-type H+-transporting ATPase subunit E [Anaerococcus nagyae]